MGRFHAGLVGAACLTVLGAVGCTRDSQSSTPGAAGKGAVQDDVKDVARTTEKAAKDIGQATVAGGQDAWITTKVKGELTNEGFDPLHVHVDTDDKVVTLSGTVDSAASKEKALSAAKAVVGVAGVKDHLFVKGPR